MGKIIRIALVILLTFIFFIGVYLFLGKKLILIPEEQLSVYKDIDALYSINVDSSKNRIAFLVPGQRLPITTCRNLKDDQIYKIRLQNGKEGYVERGKYKVVREDSKRFDFFRKVICY